MSRVRAFHRILAALSCALTLNGLALVALAATTVGISGREFFPGVHYGAATYGASFAGLTTAGGRIEASVNYLGPPGLGNKVTIFGGWWLTKNAGAPGLSGRVSGGVVAWPADLNSDIGCGNGVATFHASLSNGGSISGCLDDAHHAAVFPPTIKGTLTLP